jgi:hypothetical protein
MLARGVGGGAPRQRFRLTEISTRSVRLAMGIEGKLLLLAAMFAWPIFTLFSALHW